MLYVKRLISKKGNPYLALVVETNNINKIVSFDTYLMRDLLDYSNSQIIEAVKTEGFLVEIK